MEIKKLRYFVTVASLKSFTAAAKELNTVQPAISRQILDLETELGTKLFIRNTREVSLTEAGLYLFANAQRLFDINNELVAQVIKLGKGEVGALRIGYLGSASFAFIGTLVQKFKSMNPNIEISIIEMTSQEQIDAFENNDIDIGFSRPVPKEYTSKINAELIYTDHLIAVLPINHSLATRKSLLFNDLIGQDLVLMSRNKATGLYNKIKRLLVDCGGDHNIVSEPSSMQTILTEVSAETGIGIVPSCVRRLYTKGCCFVPLTIDNPDINKAVTTDTKALDIPLEIQYPHRGLSIIAQRFVEYTIDHKALITELSNH